VATLVDVTGLVIYFSIASWCFTARGSNLPSVAALYDRVSRALVCAARAFSPVEIAVIFPMF
jgi:hypothetical protein